MLKSIKISISVLLTSIILLSISLAQVTISPTSLFIDNQRRFETLLVLNSTEDPQEVTISYQFGYPVSDSYGNLTMNYGDTELGDAYSAADWIKGFPKSFVLEPGKRQVVRLTAKPPNNLADGTYWTRLKTVSTNLTPTVGEPQQEKITAQISFKFEQITGVFYKSGDVTTGLDITAVRNEIVEQKLLVYADLDKAGNSPYLGTMRVDIFNLSGKKVQEERIFISVYFDGTRRIETDISELPAGRYSAKLTFIAERDDIPNENLVHVEPITESFKFSY
ncbi:MAG: hypothetical protein H8E14_18645 [Candidatus Marinimicrobia bacterium]|nr:hypothetical protein [Candidatus Neomarinimicrobiota bacterium]